MYSMKLIILHTECKQKHLNFYKYIFCNSFIPWIFLPTAQFKVAVKANCYYTFISVFCLNPDILMCIKSDLHIKFREIQ